MIDYKIIEYNNNYFSKLQKFLINVAVKEYNYSEWLDYFNEMKFLPQNADEVFYIAIDNANEIIGSIGATKIDNNVVKLHSLYVNKDYRNNGVGKNLYNTLLKFITQKNYTTIILNTFDKFNIAIKFYEKEGFSLYKDGGKIDGFWYQKIIKV